MSCARTQIPILVGDYGDERCGVGASTAAWVADHLDDVAVWDRVIWRELLTWRRAAMMAGRAVVVYPTRSSRFSLGALLAGMALLGSGVRRVMHLHEARRLHRLHRLYIWAIMKAWRPCLVVVSTASEAAYIVGRCESSCSVRVCPPANGTAPTDDELRLLSRSQSMAGDGLVVGVFGIPRRDKGGISGLASIGEVRSVVRRLEFVGDGWQDWDGAVTGLGVKEVSYCGYVERARLGEIFSSWDAAYAPLSDGASDARLSVRTPLAWGVPTLTFQPLESDDLTLVAPHVGFIGESDIGSVAALGEVSREGALCVARMEGTWRRRLAEAILSGG